MRNNSPPHAKQLAKRTDQPYAPLRRLVQPYILRRLKTDPRVITDLPEKTEVRAFCGLSREQAALYEQCVQTLAQKLQQTDGIQRRGAVLASLMQLKQICNHPAQWHGHGRLRRRPQRQVRRLGGVRRGARRTPGEGPGLHTVPRDHRAARPVSRGVFAGPGWYSTAARPSSKRRNWSRHFSARMARHSSFSRSKRAAPA